MVSYFIVKKNYSLPEHVFSILFLRKKSPYLHWLCWAAADQLTITSNILTNWCLKRCELSRQDKF